MRVLLDTNVLISYALISNPESPIVRIVDAAIEGSYTLIVPAELLDEFVLKVGQKKYLAERIPPQRLAELVRLIRAVAESPPALSHFPSVTRDPTDDFLIAYALVANADYLVTGDNDLLSIGSVRDLHIVTPAHFLDLLAAQS